jgi:hypothetical protein
MDDNIDTPWWRSALRAMAGFFGLLALSAVLMGGIIFVARFLDTSQSGGAAAPIHVSVTPAGTPDQNNARTRGPSSFGFDVLTNSPGRPAGVAASSHPTLGRPPLKAQEPPPVPVPVGLSTEEYQAATTGEKKVYLPNPKGECDLSGVSTDKSANALKNCFAERAAR